MLDKKSICTWYQTGWSHWIACAEKSVTKRCVLHLISCYVRMLLHPCCGTGDGYIIRARCFGTELSNFIRQIFFTHFGKVTRKLFSQGNACKILSAQRRPPCSGHNSFWPSDDNWRYRPVATLVQVMTCCLSDGTKLLLIISDVLCHSLEDNSTGNGQDIYS